MKLCFGSSPDTYTGINHSKFFPFFFFPPAYISLFFLSFKFFFFLQKKYKLLVNFFLTWIVFTREGKLVNQSVPTYNFFLYIVLVLSYINMNLPRVYICCQAWTTPPPQTIPLGHPSAPAPSILYPASNLDWCFVSHMILYMFQCHSPKSFNLLPLPQSPKDCSIHLCLFCCLTYRIIITIFLNSIYMR